MNLLTTFYVCLVLAGVAWIAYRLWRQIRFERKDDSDQALSLSDEQLKIYLASLKSQKPRK